jgi:cytoskeleton protein RodZ
MSELGRLLREARTAKELTLADVESATRIRQKYLEALENGDFAKLPRGPVARGFLRTYATFLGLDVTDALSRYTQESGDAGDEIEIAEPGKPRLIDYRPLEVTLHDPAPARWWPWVVAALIVIAAGVGVVWLLNRNLSWNFLSAFGPAPTATSTATATRVAATLRVVTATSAPTATPVPPTPTSDLLPLPTPTVPPTITPTPRPTATPEVATGISLAARILQRAWVRVVVDGQVAEENTLEADTTHTWEANNSITVRTGNGGGVSLALNGEDLGPMGAVGQVVERTWIFDQGQLTEATTGTPVPTRAPTQTATPTPAG